MVKVLPPHRPIVCGMFPNSSSLLSILSLPDLLLRWTTIVAEPISLILFVGVRHTTQRFEIGGLVSTSSSNARVVHAKVSTWFIHNVETM